MKAISAITAAALAALAAITAHARGAETAAAFIKAQEGFRSKAYKDSGGVNTIGYGFTDADLVAKGRLTKSEASAALVARCRQIRAQLRSELEGRITLTPTEETAVISFIYNVGFETFRKSTMCRKLKAGKRGVEVAAEFAKWVYVRKGGRMVKCGGLVRRRRRESRLFLA